MQIELPPNFYWDHVARGLPAGRVVREKRKTIVVELDREEVEEILDDARHYSEAGPGYWEGVSIGLISSARATVKRLVAAGVDSGPSSHEIARALGPIEKRRYVFANPDPAGFPKTIQANAFSEDEARRAIARDLPRTREWLLVFE